MTSAYARRSVQTLLRWDKIDSEKAEFLKTVICEQSRVMLEYWRASATRSSDGQQGHPSCQIREPAAFIA